MGSVYVPILRWRDGPFSFNICGHKQTEHFVDVLWRNYAAPIPITKLLTLGGSQGELGNVVGTPLHHIIL